MAQTGLEVTIAFQGIELNWKKNLWKYSWKQTVGWVVQMVPMASSIYFFSSKEMVGWKAGFSNVSENQKMAQITPATPSKGLSFNSKNSCHRHKTELPKRYKRRERLRRADREQLQHRIQWRLLWPVLNVPTAAPSISRLRAWTDKQLPESYRSWSEIHDLEEMRICLSLNIT